VTPLQTARGHARKAQEFLDEAHAALHRGHVNVSASNAIIAGINAKDAICLALVGVTSKTADHAQAVPELRRVGKLGAELAPVLDRLLRSKTRSQYQSVAVAVAVSDAEAAIRQAQRLVAAAVSLVAEQP
jgi:hypothetical protein